MPLKRKIITDFRTEKQAQRDKHCAHIDQLKRHHPDALFLKSAMQTNQLQIGLADTYLTYLDTIESELK